MMAVDALRKRKRLPSTPGSHFPLKRAKVGGTPVRLSDTKLVASRSLRSRRSTRKSTRLSLVAPLTELHRCEVRLDHMANSADAAVTLPMHGKENAKSMTKDVPSRRRSSRIAALSRSPACTTSVGDTHTKQGLLHVSPPTELQILLTPLKITKSDVESLENSADTPTPSKEKHEKKPKLLNFRASESDAQGCFTAVKSESKPVLVKKEPENLPETSDSESQIPKLEAEVKDEDAELASASVAMATSSKDETDDDSPVNTEDTEDEDDFAASLEKRRLQNIRENAAFLAKINMGEAVLGLREMTATSAKKPPKPSARGLKEKKEPEVLPKKKKVPTATLR